MIKQLQLQEQNLGKNISSYEALIQYYRFYLSIYVYIKIAKSIIS